MQIGPNKLAYATFSSFPLFFLKEFYASLSAMRKEINASAVSAASIKQWVVIRSFLSGACLSIKGWQTSKYMNLLEEEIWIYWKHNKTTAWRKPDNNQNSEEKSDNKCTYDAEKHEIYLGKQTRKRKRRNIICGVGRRENISVSPLYKL